jgi:hypothetical protein
VPSWKSVYVKGNLDGLRSCSKIQGDDLWVRICSKALGGIAYAEPSLGQPIAKKFFCPIQPLFCRPRRIGVTVPISSYKAPAGTNRTRVHSTQITDAFVYEYEHIEIGIVIDFVVRDG